MEKPNIEITIPTNFSREFLGIMTIDILHDARGYGYLAGKPLSAITNLLAYSVIWHNNIPKEREMELKLYIFRQILLFCLDLWEYRLDALGIGNRPNLETISNEELIQLYNKVLIPVRNVGGRDNVDTFVSLGANRYSPEAQNYHNQRAHLQVLSFISPLGINKPEDFFNQAKSIVDTIQSRRNNSHIVLDMKASAGLMRTILDPIGYIVGIPTYADPGYQKPGMSAIRKYSSRPFVPETSNIHFYKQESSEFSYRISLQTDLYTEPLILFTAKYFYGIAQDGLERDNLLIEIFDEIFPHMLPHSTTMAETINQYLTLEPLSITMNKKKIIEILCQIIWEIFEVEKQEEPVINDIYSIYNNLHKSTEIDKEILQRILKKVGFSSKGLKNILDWCKNNYIRVSLIMESLKMLYYYDIKKYRDCRDLQPENIITNILPQILDEFKEDNNIRKLGYCWHQYNLILEYIKMTGDSSLDILLKQQVLHRGKFITQIERIVHEREKYYNSLFNTEASFARDYLQKLFRIIQEYQAIIVNIDELLISDKSINMLIDSLPTFNPPRNLRNILYEYICLENPRIYKYIDEKILLATWLPKLVMLDEEILLNINVDNWPNFYIDNLRKALRIVLGKFSGDFGQIIWCIYTGNIFATEDNNASAMALLLQRLPKEAFSHREKWINIHGLGDGGSVDIIFSQN